MASATSEKHMELEGTIGAFHLPDILRFLAMGKMTGMLTVSNDHRDVKLLIREGKLVGTGSDERYLKLGQLLVYNGQIARKDLEDALEAQREGMKSRMLGELLIERKLVSREQIQDALALQVKEGLWELFSWTSGKFKFEHGLPPAVDRVMLSMEIEPLLGEGHERMEQWNAITQVLGDPNSRFRVRGDLIGMPDVKLDPNAWRVLSLINGRHTAQSLICLSGLGKFETLSALNRLLGLSLVESAQIKQDDASVEHQEAIDPEVDTQIDESPHNASESGGNGTARRRWFGRRRADEPDNKAVVDSACVPGRLADDYSNGVAVACEIVNRVLSALCRQGAYPSVDQADVARQLWTDAGMRFARADMICIRGGKYDSSELDRYIELAGGVERNLMGCHEDSLAALVSIGQCMFQRARDHLGDRGEQLLVDLVKPYLAQLNIRHPADFTVQFWTRQWMGTSI